MNSPIVKVWRAKGFRDENFGDEKFVLKCRTADGRRWIFSLAAECSYWHETNKPYIEGEEPYNLNSTAFGVDDVRAM